MALIETEDILTTSGYTVETKEDRSGNIIFDASKLFS